MHISSNYAKILGETNFRTREIPRSESKVKHGERRKRKKERTMVILTMAKLCMANASTHGTRKLPGPIDFLNLKPVKVLQECREKYPEYEIFDNPEISKSVLNGRLHDTDASFWGFHQDIHMLTMANFVVCTHTSNVSNLQL